MEGLDVVCYQRSAQEFLGMPANDLPAILAVFPVQLVGIYIVGILMRDL